MKKIYIFAAVLALLTLSLNAQYSQVARKQKQVQRVDKSKDTGKAVDVRVHDLMSGTKDAPADAVSVPYYNHMTTDEEFEQLGTYDANGDATDSSNSGKWAFFYTDNTQTDVIARYTYSSSNAADDYLIIFVPVILQAGKSYSFSMDVRANGYTEKYEVVMFDQLSTASITSGTPIIPVTSISSSTVSRVKSEPFSVSTESYMYFAVHCVSDADMYYLYVDNLAIEVEESDDLMAAISAPESVPAGGTATVTATVTNNGTDAVQGYTVNITANGSVIFTQTVNTSLAAGASATYTANYTTTEAQAGQNVNFGVEVVYNDDEPANNTASTSTYVLATPPPVNVAATANEQSGTMTWSAPSNLPMVPASIAWDFEEEADFTAFTTIDADGDGYNWIWQLNGTGSSNMTTHGGSGVVYSESYHNTGTNSGQALNPNNWMISPEVTLGGTLTLWACGQDANYPAEVFGVFVCVGSYNGTTSFVQVDADVTTTSGMTQYTFDLSQYSGQGHFAIVHHNVSDEFILNIDDVEYQYMVPQQPVSYNIYLDGQLVGNVDANTFSYTFDNLADGEHECAVSAVYSYGESVAVPATFTISTVNPTIEISPATQTINDAAAGTLTVTGTDIDGNINVSAADNDWTVNPTSLAGTGGNVNVTYTGRDLSASTTVTASATGATDASATVDYVADLYIVGNYGSGWDFANGTSMTNANGTYTATLTVDAGSYILFARLLGNSNPWNTRDVFGPDSNGDWWMQGNSASGNIDLNDDDPIYFQEGGTYRITINANDGTFTITKLHGEQTAAPTITYSVSSDGEHVTITATGNGTVTLNVPGCDPVSGNGSASITVPCGYVSNTITVTATAQEDGKDESDPATAQVNIPAGTDWVEMDGTYDNPNDLLSFLKGGEDIMMLDQFTESTLNNDHPAGYTYTLQEIQNGEHKISTPVPIPVYKTNSSMDGFYTYNEIIADTDMHLKAGVVNAKMNYDVKPDGNTLYYSLYRDRKVADPAVQQPYPVIDAPYRVSQLQGFEENTQYFMFESHPVGVAPRYDHVGNEIVERLDTNYVQVGAGQEMSYVPVIWTLGINTARGDGKDNTYGSDIKTEKLGEVGATYDAYYTTGDYGKFKVGNVEYCIYYPEIKVTGTLPAAKVVYNDDDEAVYTPFMYRAWCTYPGARNFTLDSDGHLIDAGALITAESPAYLLQTEIDETRTEVTLGGDTWKPGQPKEQWAFGVPVEGVNPSDITFVVRFYYKKTTSEVAPNGLRNQRAEGDDDHAYYIVETRGSVDRVITAVNELYGAGVEPVSVTYVNAQGMQSSKPFDGINIVVTRYSDGSTTTSKIVR